MDSETPRRAAQYLRMSTEHQRYSLENQAAVIGSYASERGLTIVRTYLDPGKSGLTLKGRPGLQQLLSDALDPARDFSTVLVLDVSRWGRFQDIDQAAHYEFICREAGVQVVYCAEAFENDGGLIASIAKSLKRVMAGEYSRELSAKVTQGKLRQARLGYRQGGSVIYGYRREVVDARDKSRGLLNAGQAKGSQTDRVRTALGPDAEVATVRRIFRLFTAEGASFLSVARTLNGEGVATQGRSWTGRRVAYLIRNELCRGIYTYNKTAGMMRKPRSLRPESEWVRVAVLKPIVSRGLFEKANRYASGGRNRYSERELLRRLTALLERAGYLSRAIIDADPATPMFMTYVARFGSIARAYDLIGYSSPGRRLWRPQIEGAWTDERILEAIRAVREKHGFLSCELIESEPCAPSPTTIRKRFGGLLACYAAAGYPTTQKQAAQASAIRHWEAKTGRTPRLT